MSFEKHLAMDLVTGLSDTAGIPIELFNTIREFKYHYGWNKTLGCMFRNIEAQL